MNKCFVCGSEERTLAFEPLGIQRCLACGFYYRGTSVSSAVYKGLQKYEEAIEDGKLIKARDREASKRTNLIKKYVQPKGSILEIGTNDGTLLRKLKLENFRVTGVEPNIKMVEVAREKGLNVLSGTLEENAKEIENRFDAVIMFHVLEHLSDPKRTLDIICRVLNKSGILIIEVPGFDGPMFTARRWYANWTTEEHLSYFTMKTLRNILAQTGFKVLYSKRRNWDEDCETFRNNFLRLPLINPLYRIYRRIKETYEPYQMRCLTDWQPFEERIPQKGLSGLVIRLVDILNRGDSLFIVAKKMNGLYPGRQFLSSGQIGVSIEVIIMTFAVLILTPFVYLKRRGRKKILIVPTSKLGDFISQLPFLKAVKNKYPDAEITILLFNLDLADFLDASFGKVIHSKGLSPITDFLRTVRLLIKENITTVFLLPWSARLDFLAYFSLIPERYGIYSKDIPYPSNITRSLLCTKKAAYERGELSTKVYLRLIGEENENPERIIDIKNEWIESMERKSKQLDLRSKRIAGIIVGCGNRLKLWSSEKWGEIANYLKKAGYEVCLIGSDADKIFAEKVKAHTEHKIVDTTGLFTLPELSAFFNKLSFVIGVDSGPLYLANAVGVPVFDLAGPCDVKEQLPKENTVTVLSAAGCAPCSYVVATQRTCRFATRRCLEELMPADVINAIETWLRR